MALKTKSLDKVRDSVPVEIVSREELVRVNLNVPVSQRQRWKMEAVSRGVPLSDLIVQAVEVHLSK